MSHEMTRNEEDGPSLFHHYLTTLVPLLTSPHRRQVSAVMQCLGHLAKPCSVLLDQDRLVQLFKKILVAGLQLLGVTIVITTSGNITDG